MSIFPARKDNMTDTDIFSPAKHTLLRALGSVQNKFSALLNPSSSPFGTHLRSTIAELQSHAKLAFDAAVGTTSRGKQPLFARIGETHTTLSRAGGAMSAEAIEERLGGVPVYALSNATEEFVLVSGVSTGKSLGLFCFKQEDAEALLQQMRTMDPAMRKGSKVVAVALNKVFQLKLDGVAFRLIPESSQVENALKERSKAGLSDGSFLGVPVFQSRSLILRSENKSYRPLFFRKEDLENYLQRASRQQRKLNPSFRQGDIQVATFEEVIEGMKDDSISEWDDVVFIPPGLDIAAAPPRQ